VHGIRGQLFMAMHYSYMHYEALKALDPLELDKQMEETKIEADFGGASFPARIKAIAGGLLLAEGAALQVALQNAQDNALYGAWQDYGKASHLLRAVLIFCFFT
jgi:hypothetical protein